MTVSTAINKVRIEGNGVTTVFNFSFKTRAVSDLSVYKVIRATGEATLQNYGAHYTASINPVTEGGQVTFLSAPADTEDVVIIRIVALTQTTKYPSESELPEIAFEDGLDKNIMAIQQVEERIGRALLFPETSLTSDKYLPEPVTGRVLEWDASGNIVNSTASLSGTITAAQAAQVAAEAAQAAAETAQTNAETAQTNAETAETNAETAETNAEAAQAAAEAARDTTVNFVNRGIWLDTTAYAVGNLVGYAKADGRFGTYMALQTHTNQNPETSSGYWVLVAQDGVSEIQFRKDIMFAASFDTVQELKDTGMITNYTSPTDPQLFPLTSVNAHQFAQANIISGGKFGKCLDFTQTAKSILLPEKNVDLSKDVSISFWIKSPVAVGRNILCHTSRAFQVTTSGTGQLRVIVTDDLGVSRSCTGTLSLTDGTAWHHILIQIRFNSFTPAAFIKIYVDGVEDGALSTSSGLRCSGMDAGRMIFGAGYTRNEGSDITNNMSTLPSAASPAWTFVGTDEATDCVVANGVLDIDTINGTGGTGVASYKIEDGANWTVSNANGYWGEIKCKINSGSLTFLIGDGTKYGAVGINLTYINDTTGRRAYLDATKYHTYRLIVKESTYWAYVDGVCMLTGASVSGSYDKIQFGDAVGSAGYNVDVSIDYVRYYQAAAQETNVIGGECDTYIDDFAFFNTIVTAADIVALQTAPVSALQTFVDGSGITNIGRSHIAIQDLIDERDYEENLACTRTVNIGSFAGAADNTLVQFRTKKRVVPTVVFTSTHTYNLSAMSAIFISRDGFNLSVACTTTGYTNWTGCWQAQCASHTKIEDITDTGFNLILGTPILDSNGDHTGKYSEEKVAVSHSDIETSKDGKIMTIRKGNVTVCMPTNNKPNDLALLGYNDSNLSVQAAKLVEKKIKVEKDKKDKIEKDKIEKEKNNGK